MITRIPISQAQNSLREIFAGLRPGDEAWVTDEQGKVLARLLPGYSSAQPDNESKVSDQQWQEALHRLTTSYDGGVADVSIDRASFYE